MYREIERKVLCDFAKKNHKDMIEIMFCAGNFKSTSETAFRVYGQMYKFGNCSYP